MWRRSAPVLDLTDKPVNIVLKCSARFVLRKCEPEVGQTLDRRFRLRIGKFSGSVNNEI